MAREKADYRDLLERLDTAFPGKELLTRKEIAEWLGCGQNTVTRRYHFPSGKVPKTQVARSLASGI
jgi:hypothetical protein